MYQTLATLGQSIVEVNRSAVAVVVVALDAHGSAEWDGRRINADINGSYNILRKEYPKAFSDSLLRGQEIVGAAVHPRRLAV